MSLRCTIFEAGASMNKSQIIDETHVSRLLKDLNSMSFRDKLEGIERFSLSFRESKRSPFVAADNQVS
jgi:hypothetical protein